MMRARFRRIAPMALIALVAMLFGLSLGLWQKHFTYKSWSQTVPLSYDESDSYYVEKALDVYTAHSTQSHEDALKEVYPLVVDFPGAVCVAMHNRPGWVDSMSTICFDAETDAVLTNYHSGMIGEHMPAKLSPPHYGEVVLYHPYKRPN